MIGRCLTERLPCLSAVRFDDCPAGRRQLVLLLGEASDNAAAAGYRSLAELCEIGLAGSALGGGLRHRRPRAQHGGQHRDEPYPHDPSPTDFHGLYLTAEMP